MKVQMTTTNNFLAFQGQSSILNQTPGLFRNLMSLQAGFLDRIVYLIQALTNLVTSLLLLKEVQILPSELSCLSFTRMQLIKNKKQDALIM